jgi:hypothetical protein
MGGYCSRIDAKSDQDYNFTDILRAIHIPDIKLT